jgi:Glycosyltransferase family 20
MCQSTRYALTCQQMAAPCVVEMLLSISDRQLQGLALCAHLPACCSPAAVLVRAVCTADLDQHAPARHPDALRDLAVLSLQRLRSMVHEIVGRINGRYGTLTENPIHHLDRQLSFHEVRLLELKYVSVLVVSDCVAQLLTVERAQLP